MTKERRGGVDTGRPCPIRNPPAGTEGMPRRLLKRSLLGRDEAAAWARDQDWWPRVIKFCREAPCNSGKYYYWILEVE